ncbi:MAG: hypothetical protein IPK61_17780 [Saprospiraceae bacterium]|nr:hypothetical protein [Saprospiraceae bacterium]
MEIGPGKGAITHSLINHVEHFKAVEADRDMVEYLRQHLGLTLDQLIPGDVLRLDFNRVFDSGRICALWQLSIQYFFTDCH